MTDWKLPQELEPYREFIRYEKRAYSSVEDSFERGGVLEDSMWTATQINLLKRLHDGGLLEDKELLDWFEHNTNVVVRSKINSAAKNMILLSFPETLDKYFKVGLKTFSIKGMLLKAKELHDAGRLK